MKGRILALVLLLVAGPLVLAQTPSGTDPILGTWKLNLQKSTFSPGPPLTSGTRKLEAWEGGFKTTQNRVNAQGVATHDETVWKFDGKDYSVKGAAVAANSTNTYRRIDERALEITNKVDGKVTQMNRLVTSPDGKTQTGTQTGTDAQGRTINNVLFWDKQ